MEDEEDGEYLFSVVSLFFKNFQHTKYRFHKKFDSLIESLQGRDGINYFLFCMT